uniref:Uncharacterized protein n=1 Tax=Caenorhabditis japonica TaxID=281687 RepID=A0A8R1HYA4_CAEJA
MPNPSQYHPGGGATSGAASSSLLAQHLASAPNPHHNYPASSQQSSHLHQLLQQPHQPSYPAGPATQQLQQQQRMVEQHRMEMAYNQQQAYHAQQEAAAAYQAQQQARQAGHQTEQNTAAFPPSASSTHSAYSLHQRAQEVPSSHNLPLPTYERQLPEKPADLSQFNTGELCIMGREIVSDLNQKTSQLAQMLKKVMERKQLNQGENPNDLSDNCRRNLDKMAEIREEIENRRPQGWKRLTGDDYIELMLDDSEVPPDEEMSEEQKVKRAELLKRMPTVMSKTPPNEGDVWYQGRWIPAELHKKYMKFEENKEKIKSLAHDLKNLSWKIEVTSPRHLKKVDQTKISKKRGEEA